MDDAEKARRSTLRAIRRIGRDADTDDERGRFLGHVVPADFAEQFEECQDIFFVPDGDDWRKQDRLVKK